MHLILLSPSASYVQDMWSIFQLVPLHRLVTLLWAFFVYLFVTYFNFAELQDIPSLTFNQSPGGSLGGLGGYKTSGHSYISKVVIFFNLLLLVGFSLCDSISNRTNLVFALDLPSFIASITTIHSIPYRFSNGIRRRRTDILPSPYTVRVPQVSPQVTLPAATRPR